MSIQNNNYLLYYSYKERKIVVIRKENNMNSIIRNEIDYMVHHARVCSKSRLRKGNFDNFHAYMKRTIERDMARTEGVISALQLAGVIGFIEYRRDRQVLKHHYCRLLSAYANEPYMYKDSDSEFYWLYIR